MAAPTIYELSQLNGKGGAALFLWTGSAFVPALGDSSGNLQAALQAGASIDIGDVQLLAGAAIIGKVGVDQTTPGSTDSVSVKGRGFGASAVFTPAAASHVAGDVVGGAQQFSSVGPVGGGVVKIIGATMMLASGTNETTAWTLHLYSVTPPSALADDAVWDIASGDRASYLGSIAISQLVDVGASCWIENIISPAKPILLASANVFGYLVNGTTLTPQAVAHTVTLLTELAG